MVAREKTGQPLPATMEELSKLIESAAEAAVRKHIQLQQSAVFQTPEAEFLTAGYFQSSVLRSPRRIDEFDPHILIARRLIRQKGAIGRQVLVKEEEQGGFSVTVPSLPGCTSQGETIREALINIRESIELYLEGLAEDGWPIPEEKNNLLVLNV